MFFFPNDHNQTINLESKLSFYMEIYQVLFRRFPHFTTLNRLTVSSTGLVRVRARLRVNIPL